MISGTSSVGKPCNMSGEGTSDLFIEKIAFSLWLWSALGGATADAVRAAGGASTAEVVRAVRGAMGSASTAELVRAVKGAG